MEITTRLVVADASVLLNLVASGRETEILAGMGVRLATPQRVVEEVRYVWDRDAESGELVRASVNLGPLMAERILVIEEPEPATLVRCVAAGLTDRDAAGVALAIDRKRELLVDDRKVRRVAAALHPEIVVRGTLEVVRAGVEGWREEDVREVCRRVGMRGNFEAPRGDPLAGWFRGMVGSP